MRPSSRSSRRRRCRRLSPRRWRSSTSSRHGSSGLARLETARPSATATCVLAACWRHVGAPDDPPDHEDHNQGGDHEAPHRHHHRRRSLDRHVPRPERHGARRGEDQARLARRAERRSLRAARAALVLCGRSPPQAHLQGALASLNHGGGTGRPRVRRARRLPRWLFRPWLDFCPLSLLLVGVLRQTERRMRDCRFSSDAIAPRPAWPLLGLPRCHTATSDYLGSSATKRVAAISDLRGSSRTAVAALVAEPDLVADGANSLGVALPVREAASEAQAAIDSTGLARRTAPGGDPTTRLNARANAASER